MNTGVDLVRIARPLAIALVAGLGLACAAMAQQPRLLLAQNGDVFNNNTRGGLAPPTRPPEENGWEVTLRPRWGSPDGGVDEVWCHLAGRDQDLHVICLKPGERPSYLQGGTGLSGGIDRPKDWSGFGDSPDPAADPPQPNRYRIPQRQANRLADRQRLINQDPRVGLGNVYARARGLREYEAGPPKSAIGRQIKNTTRTTQRGANRIPLPSRSSGARRNSIFRRNGAPR